MFTGIIQDLGTLSAMNKGAHSIEFTVSPLSKTFLKDVNTGDSISINGACMTVEKSIEGQFTFTTISESLKKTNLGLLEMNDVVNLEKAMTLHSKLDGHIVQGHIDTTGNVCDIVINDNVREYFIEFPAAFRNNVIPVGSIAINGVSLTIAEIINETQESVRIKVAIIPHTFEVTNFKKLVKNDRVNIEFDLMGKYVLRRDT
ncbi:MAG: riboflavin synthase [bacterium]|nr:riboflavin synthase [bacterium]